MEERQTGGRFGEHRNMQTMRRYVEHWDRLTGERHGADIGQPWGMHGTGIGQENG